MGGADSGATEVPCEQSVEGAKDKDGDGVRDQCDNCPTVANVDQSDLDQDGRGDSCEKGGLIALADEDQDGIINVDDLCPFDVSSNGDQDGDRVGDECDNCPSVANNDQLDGDSDKTGNACADLPDPTADADGDTVPDISDNCVSVANPGQDDGDGDRVGNVCDNCPGYANYLQEDSNGNGQGDACEGITANPNGDDDGDGTPNATDKCPQTADDQADTDGDSVGNACDNCPSDANADQSPAACDVNADGDDDGDGVPNRSDNCRNTSSANQNDTDQDGRGDICDNCLYWANYTQVDSDQNGVGDACQGRQGTVDSDGDGRVDTQDNCPGVANGPQQDSDGDGRGDACDNCPQVYNPEQQNERQVGNPDVGDHCDPDYQFVSSPVCAEGTARGSNLNPNLFFLVDNSNSMERQADTSCSGTCDSRRQAWNRAVNALSSRLTSGRFNLGLGRFPGIQEWSCRDLPYIRLGMSAGVSADVFRTAARIAIDETWFGTPTSQALRRVRRLALYNLPGDTANRPKAIVLVTDGMPNAAKNDCNADGDGSTNALQETIAEARTLAGLGVTVYVMGFKNESGESGGASEANLQAIANAGDPAPGDNRWYSVKSTEEIVAGLEAILDSTVSCTMPLNGTGGGALDPRLSAVYLKYSNGNSEVIPRFNGTDGYSFDGATLELRGNSCTRFKLALRQDPGANVEAKVGCACAATGSAERCDTSWDDNCNGRINEGCEERQSCADTPSADCPQVCTKHEVCNDGVSNDCDAEIDEGCPSASCTEYPEICDGTDNDCDGTVDDGCAPPVPVCGLEVCDGADNDCDGSIDEGCTPACTPYLESCDSLDNDCDSIVDEECISCLEPASEVCDGLDNDCDGVLDDGCPPVIE